MAHQPGDKEFEEQIRKDQASTADHASPYVSDDEIEALREERRFLEESPEEYGKRLLQEKVGDAVLSLTKLAIHGSNETVRMNASKYVIERVLGKIQEFPNVDKAEWEKLLDASYVPDKEEAPTNASNRPDTDNLKGK